LLSGSPPSGNKFNYVQIKFAGGNSGHASYGCGPGDNDAALLISDWTPADVFAQNVSISDSAAGASSRVG